MFSKRIKAAIDGFMNPGLIEKARQPSKPAKLKKSAPSATSNLDLSEFDSAFKKQPKRSDRYFHHINIGLEHAGLTGGKMLEIGGRKNPLKKFFPQFEYTPVDLQKYDESVLVADITSCPQIPDNSFDFIVSIDVFEHINAPWLAAKEIARILKPGGVTYHTTLFSWRYHPCPIDYWRYSPEALKFIFSDLECIAANFDDAERRRNLTGEGGAHPIAEDGMGGWRENWRVHYVGTKPKNARSGQ